MKPIHSAFFIHSAFCILHSALSISAATAPEIDLAVRGEAPAYTIVSPADASPAVRYAAEELRGFTQKTTGVWLPIVRDQGSGVRDQGTGGPGAVPAADLPEKAIVLEVEGTGNGERGTDASMTTVQRSNGSSRIS